MLDKDAGFLLRLIVKGKVTQAYNLIEFGFDGESRRPHGEVLQDLERLGLVTNDPANLSATDDGLETAERYLRTTASERWR